MYFLYVTTFLSQKRLNNYFLYKKMDYALFYMPIMLCRLVCITKKNYEAVNFIYNFFNYKNMILPEFWGIFWFSY